MSKKNPQDAYASLPKNRAALREVFARAEGVAVDRLMALRGKSVFAYSGGKDSVVVARLCETAGIHEGLSCLYPHEQLWTAHAKYLEAHKPPMVKVYWRKETPAHWARKGILFKGLKAFLKADLPLHWKAIDAAVKDANAANIIHGRRVADGNNPGCINYKRKTGEQMVGVIGSWSHAQVLAFLVYYDSPCIPLYLDARTVSWENGICVPCYRSLASWDDVLVRDPDNKLAKRILHAH